MALLPKDSEFVRDYGVSPTAGIIAGLMVWFVSENKTEELWVVEQSGVNNPYDLHKSASVHSRPTEPCITALVQIVLKRSTCLCAEPSRVYLRGNPGNNHNPHIVLK